MKKPKGYWTKERVFEEAKKYQTRMDFKNGSMTAYSVACKNKWINKMTWFKKTVNYNKKWYKENVFEEARKYKSKSEFKKGCASAYKLAWKNGWLSEMTWFTRPVVHNKKWTKEKVFEEARKYQTRSEFHKCCTGAYEIALKNNWLDEMDWLVNGRVKMFTDKIDCVYKYYWEETNSIYIGRTIQPNIRDKAHIFDYRDTVHKYAKENGLAVPPMEIIEDNITVIEGQEREDYWVNYYKENGYNVLNIAKTGQGSSSIGTIGGWKWTKEIVFEEAMKCETKNEFKKSNYSAYQVARKKGWLKEMTWFLSPYKSKGYWNIKDNVIKESKKYNKRSEFNKTCPGAYNVAWRNGWLDELFPKYKSVA